MVDHSEARDPPTGVYTVKCWCTVKCGFGQNPNGNGPKFACCPRPPCLGTPSWPQTIGATHTAAPPIQNPQPHQQQRILAHTRKMRCRAFWPAAFAHKPNLFLIKRVLGPNHVEGGTVCGPQQLLGRHLQAWGGGNHQNCPCQHTPHVLGLAKPA